MEKIERYKILIAEVIERPASSKTINQPQLQKQLLVDRSKENFLLFNTGWNNSKQQYIHDLLFHIELNTNGEVWILENSTDYPLSEKLIAAGIDEKDVHNAWTQKETIAFLSEPTAITYYPAIVKKILERMASSVSLNATNLKKRLIIDDDGHDFALFSSGWHDEIYIYDLLLRIKIVEQEVQILENNTDYPVEGMLIKEGVASEDIFLSWSSSMDSTSTVSYL